MRTQDEILERFKACSGDDIFGFESHEYLRAMTKETVESLRGNFLKEDADLSELKPDLIDDESILKQCIEYMPFAWEKANNGRGISASRSLAHYKAWLWLLGEDSFDGVTDYQYYGKDNLIKICEYLNLDSSNWDDGIRTNG